jgi:hypothetical protein
VYHRYDVRGLLTQARFTSDSGAGITNTYDGFGWLRSSSSNMGGTARTVNSPNYDARGNRTRITHPDGKFFEYEYDTADRLFHLSENGPSITLASLFYDGHFFHVARRDHRSWLHKNRGFYVPASRFAEFEYGRAGLDARNYLFLRRGLDPAAVHQGLVDPT